MPIPLIPAQAGIQRDVLSLVQKLDPRFRGDAAKAAEVHTEAVIHCSSFCFGAAPTWRDAS
jgi:hypothetical protein